MARYINEDEFVAWVKEHWCADCNNDNGLRCRACWIDDAIDIVEEAPPADVVPRAEVEKLLPKLDRLEEKIDLHFAKLKQSEQQLTEEIFEEIEKILAYNYLGYARCYQEAVASEIANLKKKYTEDITHKGV